MPLPIGPASTEPEVRAAVEEWVTRTVPEAWRLAAHRGGRSAIREVRSRAEYEAWYPSFAASGLAVATWPVAYGGLDLGRAQAAVAEAVLAPYNLGRLNPLGLNNTAPALFSHGTEEQRLRFLPPIVRNEERWCQLFSEPGAGSDLASLATRAVRDGDEWVLDGQKVWTTWATHSEFAIALARTDPSAPKRKGITYFLVDLRAPGVTIRPLRHLGGEVDFSEVFLDGVRVPDAQRVGAVGDGWRVAGATLAGERQMVAGAGSGGVDRIGGASTQRLIARSHELGREHEPHVRQRLAALSAEERIRNWTNQRVRAAVRAGGTPGPAASIGKVHQGTLNQRVQLAATDLLGMHAMAWDPADSDTGPPSAPSEPSELPEPLDPIERWAVGMPFETKGMLRSRANTIEGGTSEVNRNVLGEKVLGLPREPDPWAGLPWEQVPRS